jgi:metal-responsive CopG/Arc/MetJ family transcriptional regulator
MSDKRKAIHARVEDPLIELLDDWRRQQPEIPPRSEAIRQLIEKALIKDTEKTAPKTA